MLGVEGRESRVANTKWLKLHPMASDSHRMRMIKAPLSGKDGCQGDEAEQ